MPETFAKDALREIAESAAEAVRGDRPPVIVLRALASLTRGEKPEHCVAMATNGSPCTWRVVALTERTLISIEATAAIDLWQFHRDENNATDPATLTSAIAVPRTAVTRVEVIATRPSDPWGNTDALTEWETSWRVHLPHEVLDLPGETSRAQERSHAIAVALLENLGSSSGT